RAPALARHLHRLAPAVGLRRGSRASALPAPPRARLLPRGRDPALVAGVPGGAAAARSGRQIGLSGGGVRLRLASWAPPLAARPRHLPLLRARPASVGNRRAPRPAHRRRDDDSRGSGALLLPSGVLRVALLPRGGDRRPPRS